MNDLLSVENLCVSYGDHEVLQNFTFSVAKGSIHAVLCPNNCGKTTLVKVLSGILCKDSGKITLDGVVLCKRNFKKYIRKIGVVLENIDEQFLCDTVLEELRFPLIHLCYSRKKMDSMVSLISKITRIDSLLSKEIFSLSYFDKVKVLLAVSMIHEPKLLLLDDIFRRLSVSQYKELFSIFQSIQKEFSTSIVFTTSSVFHVEKMGQITVLGNHKVLLSGSFDEIILQDNELTKLGLQIPLMVDLSRKLQFYHLVDEIYYDVNKVVDRLWK